ncbi:MAG: DNA-processing protein DprA [Tetrasphaera sp.]
MSAGPVASRIAVAAALDERSARILLARLAEPGDKAVAAELDRIGYVRVIEEMAAGSGALDRLRPRLARLRRGEEWIDDRHIAERLGARILTPADAEWPAGLNDLEQPPHCLWVRGSAALAAVCRRSVAVVGSRTATAYGVDRSGEIAAGLSERGFTIVSGAAFGIDAAAHRGALAAEGVTIAVLACGIDRAYPAAHATLLAEIARAGAVVTELPPGSAPFRGRFLQRNRLIAAMTRGVIVVEAALRSGSLATAGSAITLGRPVGAVPGPVTSMASAGCHQWIRDQKAMLVTDSAEAADLVGDLGRDAAEAPRGEDVASDVLPPEQWAVWEVLPLRHAASVEAIAERCAREPAAVRAALGSLELAGLAARVEGRWRRPSKVG